MKLHPVVLHSAYIVTGPSQRVLLEFVSFSDCRLERRHGILIKFPTYVRTNFQATLDVRMEYKGAMFRRRIRNVLKVET